MLARCSHTTGLEPWTRPQLPQPHRGSAGGLDAVQMLYESGLRSLGHAGALGPVRSELSPSMTPDLHVAVEPRRLIPQLYKCMSPSFTRPQSKANRERCIFRWRLPAAPTTAPPQPPSLPARRSENHCRRAGNERLTRPAPPSPAPPRPALRPAGCPATRCGQRGSSGQCTALHCTALRCAALLGGSAAEK